MKYSFFIYGHENISSLHKNTVEMTKEDYVTKRGDCIIGIKSDFDVSELRKFSGTRVNIYFLHDDKKLDELSCDVPKSLALNLDGHAAENFVVRRSDFLDHRTFGISASKAAGELDRELVNMLKKKERIKVLIESLE